MRRLHAFVAGLLLIAAVAGAPPAHAQEPGCTGEACATESPTPAPSAPLAGTGTGPQLVTTGEAVFVVAMATLALGGLVLAVVPGRRRR